MPPGQNRECKSRLSAVPCFQGSTSLQTCLPLATLQCHQIAVFYTLYRFYNNLRGRLSTISSFTSTGKWKHYINCFCNLLILHCVFKIPCYSIISTILFTKIQVTLSYWQTCKMFSTFDRIHVLSSRVRRFRCGSCTRLFISRAEKNTCQYVFLFAFA